MKAQNYIFTMSLIGLLAFAVGINALPKKTQGKTVTQTKTGDILDFDSKKHVSLPSGLKHTILKEGTGSKPYAGETVTVDYTGWLLDGHNKVGKKFDSSVDRGQNFEFPLGMGHVIKGWDLTVADMKMGEKRLVIIPANLGYGARGAGASIPGNATLIFEIDLYGSH